MTEQMVDVHSEDLEVIPEEPASKIPDDMSQPPTMNPDELSHVLERGRLVSRLNAARKLSTLVMSYTRDPQTESSISGNYLELVARNVTVLEQDLERFELEHAGTSGSSSNDEVDIKGSTDTVEPSIIKPVKDDFLKRREQAICSQIDPELFFPEKGGSTREAKKICKGSCELRDECLEYALTKGERFGIWGGLSERERRKLANKASA